MPTLSKRNDSCYIIRMVLHNKEEDYCTWQVDDARNTLLLLNERGVNTNVEALPAEFSFTILRELKNRGWISTENQAGLKLISSKSKPSGKRKKKEDKPKGKSSRKARKSKRRIGKSVKPLDDVWVECSCGMSVRSYKSKCPFCNSSLKRSRRR